MLTKNEIYTLVDLLKIVRKHILLIVTLTTLIALSAVGISYKMPQKFKSIAIINIRSNYFQSPLVSDLISEVQDPNELNSQRMSLLKQSLNDEFVDKLGINYKIYKYPNDPEMLIVERAYLLEDIEFFSTSKNTFQISVIASNPKLAKSMLEDVLKQMRRTLAEERERILFLTHVALEKNVRELQNNIMGMQQPSSSLNRSLKNELEENLTKIKRLSAQYTEAHPDVLTLKDRVKTITNLLKSTDVSKIEVNNTLLLGQTSLKGKNSPAIMVYNELLKKLSYLNIAIEIDRDQENVSYLSIVQKPIMPVKAFSPNKPVIALVGITIGLILSSLIIFYIEVNNGTFKSPKCAAEFYGFNLLAELPMLKESDYKKLNFDLMLANEDVRIESLKAIEIKEKNA